ncbi:hypothetical protein [Mesorhizobium sp. M0478]|uniref:hypothetical protein n=1 Tax=Mesorhizobium sp. M0478 TaxID=2956947 RepID=UPI003334DE12
MNLVFLALMHLVIHVTGRQRSVVGYRIVQRGFWEVLRGAKSVEQVIQKAIEEAIQGNIVSLKKAVAFIRTKRPDLKEELDELGEDNPLCERVVLMASQSGRAVLFDLHD